MLNESQGRQLADYVAVVRRRKLVIIFVSLVVVGTAVGISMVQTPVYEGRARLRLEATQSPFDQSGLRLDPTFVQTEIQEIQSEPVREEVRKRIGVAPRVTALAVGQTSVIEVRAESTNPGDAALITNTYAESYIDYRRQQAVDALFAVGQELQQKVDALQKEIDELAERIAAIPPCTGNNPPPNCGQRDSLQRDRDVKISQQTPFKQKLDQLQVDSALKNGGAKLSSRARVPTDPIRPRPVRNGLLGLGAGLVFGVALAFLFEHLDDSIKTKEDLERVVPNLPVLGLIPVVPGWKRGEVMLVSKASPTSAPAEAYRTLRTSIGFAGLDRSMQLIQVTSPSAAEGKTTTCANLAIALARAGKRVLLVDADLRRPRIHQFFGLSNTVGFTSVLLGEASLSNACQPVPDEPRVMLLGSGPLAPNPSELLASPRTDKILSAIRTNTDVVLLDCPPVLPVTDAAVLSSRVDGTLLVVTAGATGKKQLARAAELLRQVGAPMVGLVLNGMSTEGGYGYAYYYGGYGRDSEHADNGSDVKTRNGKRASRRFSKRR
ncbi:MAG: polysaccharide biosynthesis tyrosine autokinase [Actinomycetota bacterium]|nr:polysaccharide biosynthesis tyrosine autokinase [Actinomycetota bacterium]